MAVAKVGRINFPTFLFPSWGRDFERMNAEILAAMDFWEREKGISRDVLAAAVQEAVLSAAKKAVGPARELRVAMEPKTGDIRAFAKLVVSDKVISNHDQISVFDARRI